MCAQKLTSIGLTEPGRLLGGDAAAAEVNVVRGRPDRNERKEGPFMGKGTEQCFSAGAVLPRRETAGSVRRRLGLARLGACARHWMGRDLGADERLTMHKTVPEQRIPGTRGPSRELLQALWECLCPMLGTTPP